MISSDFLFTIAFVFTLYVTTISEFPHLVNEFYILSDFSGQRCSKNFLTVFLLSVSQVILYLIYLSGLTIISADDKLNYVSKIINPVYDIAIIYVSKIIDFALYIITFHIINQSCKNINNTITLTYNIYFLSYFFFYGIFFVSYLAILSKDICRRIIYNYEQRSIEQEV